MADGHHPPAAEDGEDRRFPAQMEWGGPRREHLGMNDAPERLSYFGWRLP